jgi:hypothetical protein
VDGRPGSMTLSVPLDMHEHFESVVSGATPSSVT